MVLRRVVPQSSSFSRGVQGDTMVLQILRFYEERLGREITEAEQEAVRTMYEEFHRPKVHHEDRELALSRISNQSALTNPGL